MSRIWAFEPEEWKEMHAEPEGHPRSLRSVVLNMLIETVLDRKRDPVASEMAYADYLRSDHWKKTRSMAIQRSGYKCSECHVESRWLEVHHLSYDRLGRESSVDLEVLCHACHYKRHFRAQLAVEERGP